jgi:hypothetical protein
VKKELAVMQARLDESVVEKKLEGGV